MNIFALHENPFTAAQMLCDKHVGKMIVESCQMLSSALRRNGATENDMPLTVAGKRYGFAHPNHPCTVWAGTTIYNYNWLADHAWGLCDEYYKRYKKIHGSEPAVRFLLGQGHKFIPSGKRTAFALCMPDDLKSDDAIASYRLYYATKDFARWEKGTPAPKWWPQKEE